MFRFIRRPAALSAAVAIAVLTLGGAATASTALLVTSHTGTTNTRTAIITQDTAAIYTGSAYVNVGGALSIYAQTGSFITATFTAESACYGTAGAWCSVRILIDGVEAEPVVGTDFAFNSTTGSGGATGWQSHAVTRVRTATTTAFHTVQVQTAEVGAATHRLDDWTLWAQVTAP
jgi:hypothetical protein